MFPRDQVEKSIAPASPFPGGMRAITTTGSPVFNHSWTLLHMPCVNIPGMVGASGMPIGVQLVGARYGDPGLLTVAAWVQRVLADNP